MCLSPDQCPMLCLLCCVPDDWPGAPKPVEIKEEPAPEPAPKGKKGKKGKKVSFMVSV